MVSPQGVEWVGRIAVLASAGVRAAVEATARQVQSPVDVYTDAAAMLVKSGQEAPACALLDTHVQGVDFLSAARALTEVATVPCFIGVWDDHASRRLGVAALDAGALGLVAMPPTTDDISRLVRTGAREQLSFTRLKVGRITAFYESRDVWVGESRIQLPEVDFALLWCLMQAFPGVVSRERLLEGQGGLPPCSPDALKVRVLRLRRRLDAAAPGAGNAVRSLRHGGYMLEER